jgi:hypothetical protein
MPIQIVFWVLYLLALVFGFIIPAAGPSPFNWRGSAGSLLIFVLIGILGWQVFGAAIRG